MANEDKATRYHRLQRRASIAGTVLGAIVLIALLLTGASAAIRTAVSSAVGGSFALTVAGYVVAIALLNEVLTLPLSFYEGVTLERRYGLSTQTDARWWTNHLKATGVSLVFAVAAALIVWSLLRAAPQFWWLLGAAAFTLILVILAQLAPVLLLPLFYDFKPLDRPALVERLVALAERAGARVMGVFEWRLSDRTKKANAALTGIGRTRRILLSDTLLAEHSDEEIEVILAHELAHHVHHDIWSGLALETVLITVGFFLADLVLERFTGSFGLTGKDDVAALPLLALTAGAVSLALLPVFNAFSRSHERRADRYALEMTRNVPAFVSAMKRLGTQNLAEEHPSRLVEILFYTHPPLNARIDAAKVWAQRVMMCLLVTCAAAQLSASQLRRGREVPLPNGLVLYEETEGTPKGSRPVTLRIVDTKIQLDALAYRAKRPGALWSEAPVVNEDTRVVSLGVRYDDGADVIVVCERIMKVSTITCGETPLAQWLRAAPSAMRRQILERAAGNPAR
jgi:STE24 endopeptidase